MAKELLRSTNSETSFQSFVLVLPLWEMNSFQDAHKNLDKDSLRELMEWNASKSTRELALDLNTPQSTICRNLKNRWSEQERRLASSYY